MPFKPGESGNPAGRPKKPRALTAILERSLNKTVHIEGQLKKVSRKRLIADQIAEALTTGQVKFTDGTTLVIENFSDWSTLVRWIYKQIDGEPPNETESEHSGTIYFKFTPHIPGNNDDSDDDADN